MAESQHPTPGITLGPGGQITDCEVLEVLEHTPSLQPKELLKLALYFNKFSTNTQLGHLLWETGLGRIVTDPIIAQDILKVTGIPIMSYIDEQEDTTSGDDDDESSEDFWDSFHFLRNPFIGPDLGLLIQKPFLEDSEPVFYVVGVCPDPRTLPEPE
jgi:hypothetical protein